jgi:hypothetical protein
MPTFVLSKVGVVLALVYLAFAIWVVITERSSSGGGGWISLPGMGTWIVTAPVSAPFEMMGMRPDFRKNIDMALTLAACAALVYFVGAGLEWVVRLLAGGGAK